MQQCEVFCPFWTQVSFSKVIWYLKNLKSLKTAKKERPKIPKIGSQFLTGLHSWNIFKSFCMQLPIGFRFYFTYHHRGHSCCILVFPPTVPGNHSHWTASAVNHTAYFSSALLLDRAYHRQSRLSMSPTLRQLNFMFVDKWLLTGGKLPEGSVVEGSVDGGLVDVEKLAGRDNEKLFLHKKP